ncbi:MAG: DUF1508 domain-containing protein [Pseudonocardiales bacterium]|nr:DUF1508 domain-containing protein [Pseudonocardiales bacterium]
MRPGIEASPQVVASRDAFDARFRRAGAQFEVYQQRAGEFRFRLRAGNGQVIATPGRWWCRSRPRFRWGSRG